MTEAYKVTLCVSCISGCSGRCPAEVQLSCFRGADASSVVPFQKDAEMFSDPMPQLARRHHLLQPSFQDRK